jgi:hypothetical protein
MPCRPSAAPALAVGEHDVREADQRGASHGRRDLTIDVGPGSYGALMPPLTILEQQVLAFERGWWRNPGAKEQAITNTFGLSTTRYYQLLRATLDKPAALVADPVLVKRLRSLRDQRAEARSARHLHTANV